jgi:hypothetical protein
MTLQLESDFLPLYLTPGYLAFPRMCELEALGKLWDSWRVEGGGFLTLRQERVWILLLEGEQE